MKFFARSLLILFALYALLFAIGDAYLAKIGAPPLVAVAFVIVFAAVQYLVAPWMIEWILDIQWEEDGAQLPARNRQFIEQLCAQRGLKVPRIGIIDSGTPNAFSFGRVRKDARVVVTSGLLDVLTPEESNAVLAHEIGHIEHWDFVVMTIAGLVPVLLYQLYVFTRDIKNVRAIAYGAYLCYWLSQYIVLLLNRTREYFADHYAAEVTHTPAALSSALIKIAYGMVKADGAYQEAKKFEYKDKKELKREERMVGTLAVMGISNLRSGAALALASANPSQAAAIMRWDLVNPWARVYEMSSTHPLTALRVRAMNAEAESMHQAVQYPLPSDQRTEWGNFPVEVFLWAVPWICGALLLFRIGVRYWLTAYGFELPAGTEQAVLILGAATWITRVWYRYHGDHQPTNVGELIQDVAVSEMRPRAVRLRGTIIGRGVPGAFWSPDLVLQDSTGMIFMLYRQSIPFARFLFAISDAEECIGQQVEIDGWFRRGLRPYVEMSRLKTEEGAVYRTYSRWVQYGVAGVALLFGVFWLLS
jgi:Zn-dependent protease with chaperone function